MFTDDVAAADNSSCNLLTFSETLQPHWFCTEHAGHFVLQRKLSYFSVCVIIFGKFFGFLDELNSH